MLSCRKGIGNLMDPVADVSTFNMIFTSVITTNPFAYVGYMTAWYTLPPLLLIFWQVLVYGL